MTLDNAVQKGYLQAGRDTAWVIETQISLGQASIAHPVAVHAFII